jgi:hypothetical protein
LATEKNLEGQRQVGQAEEGGNQPGYVLSLVLGDVLVFLLFAFFGLTSHHEINSGPLLLQVVWVALPFMLAWFLVAPWLGVYRRRLERSTRRMTFYTLRAWVISWPVAMAFRWFLVERLHPVTPDLFLTFSLVVFFTVLVLLIVWRWPFAWYRSARARGGH